MDLLTILEIIMVAGVIVLQFLVYNRNQKEILSHAQIYPESKDLKLFSERLTKPSDEENKQTGPRIPLLDDDNGYHPIFRQVIRTTNAYLRKNSGEAEFDILKEYGPK